VLYLWAGNHGSQTHQACIAKWLEKHDSCPICRRGMRDPVLEDMRRFPDDLDKQTRGCRWGPPCVCAS
jgi:hypothetical protein